MIGARWALALVALLMGHAIQVQTVQRASSNSTHVETQVKSWSLENPDASGTQLALTVLPMIHVTQ